MPAGFPAPPGPPDPKADSQPHPYGISPHLLAIARKQPEGSYVR